MPRCWPRQSCKRVGPFVPLYALGQVVEALIPIIVTRHRLIASGDGAGA